MRIFGRLSLSVTPLNLFLNFNLRNKAYSVKPGQEAGSSLVTQHLFVQGPHDNAKLGLEVHHVWILMPCFALAKKLIYFLTH